MGWHIDGVENRVGKFMRRDLFDAAVFSLGTALRVGDSDVVELGGDSSGTDLGDPDAGAA